MERLVPINLVLQRDLHCINRAAVCGEHIRSRRVQLLLLLNVVLELNCCGFGVLPQARCGRGEGAGRGGRWLRQSATDVGSHRWLPKRTAVAGNRTHHGVLVEVGEGISSRKREGMRGRKYCGSGRVSDTCLHVGVAFFQRRWVAVHHVMRVVLLVHVQRRERLMGVVWRKGEGRVARHVERKAVAADSSSSCCWLPGKAARGADRHLLLLLVHNALLHVMVVM